MQQTLETQRVNLSHIAVMLQVLPIFVAELAIVFISPETGFLSYIAVLFLLIIHSALVDDEELKTFVSALVLIPLIRIMSLSLPLIGLPLEFQLLAVSVPLFLSTGIMARRFAISLQALGFQFRKLHLELFVILAGFPLGVIEYLILQPEPLTPSLSLADIWFPALVLLVSTGLLEELIFRGLLQNIAIRAWGVWAGLMFTGLIFAILHIGYLSLIDFIFVYVVSVFFGLIVTRTQSIFGVTISHGLVNITMLIFMPHIVG